MEIRVIEGSLIELGFNLIGSRANTQALPASRVEQAIYAASPEYHKGLSTMSLDGGEVVLAPGDRADHGGDFDDVMFYVAPFTDSVDTIVYQLVKGAYEADYPQIALPVMGSGMPGRMSMEEVVQANFHGVTRFQEKYPDADFEVVFVVYCQPELLRLMNQGLVRFQHTERRLAVRRARANLRKQVLESLEGLSACIQVLERSEISGEVTQVKVDGPGGRFALEILGELGFSSLLEAALFIGQENWNFCKI